jgi:hypothetical protein
MLWLAQTLIVCPSHHVYSDRGPTVHNNHVAEYKSVQSHSLQCLTANITEMRNSFYLGNFKTNRLLKDSGTTCVVSNELRSLNSSFSIVTRLRAGRPENRSLILERRKLFSSKRPGFIQPPIQRGPGALPPGLIQPGRQAHHSPPPRAEVKNARSYTSTLPYIFKARCLIKKLYQKGVMKQSKLVEW